MMMPTLGPDWMDPQWLLDRFGNEFIWVSALILFVECGLFFPFLPGDTLLFALGLFVAGGQINIALVPLLALVFVAAIAGNIVGYEIGRKLGPSLRNREGRIIKKEYFDKTEAFFDKYGNKALVLGRFVPFVRTYITVVAGIGRMERKRFYIWSAVGAAAWAIGITLLGYFLGVRFPVLGKNIEYAVIAIFVVFLLPVAFEWWRHKRQSDQEPSDPVA